MCLLRGAGHARALCLGPVPSAWRLIHYHQSVYTCASRGVELLHQEDPQLYTKLLTWPRVAQVCSDPMCLPYRLPHDRLQMHTIVHLCTACHFTKFKPAPTACLLQGGTAALTACLAPHLRQLASQALHSFSQMAQVQPHDSASPDGAHAPQQVVPHACAGMMFMLVGERVVPSAQSTEAGTSAAPGPSQPPTASTSLQQPSTAPPLPVDIEVLCIPYSAPSPDIGIDVAVMGPPRHIAHAKHSEWMLTRKSLEAATPPGMSEVSGWACTACMVAMALCQVHTTQACWAQHRGASCMVISHTHGYIAQAAECVK